MAEIKKLPQNIEFLSPVFKENYINIVFSSSDYYAPYLGVALYSLVKNSSKAYNYDIVVFTQDISETNQNLLQDIVKQSNVSLRFYKMNNIFSGTHIYVPPHINTLTLETYYRIFAPYVLKNYKKTLFLDSDMLILHDVSELYKTDISQYALAASHEILFEASHIEAQFYELQRQGKFENIREESIKRGKENALQHVKSVGVNKIEKYFQAGLILFNNNYFNEKHLVAQLFDNIQQKNYIIVNQDALNEVCYGHTLILDHKWNFTPTDQGNYFKHLTPQNKEKVLSVKNPQIIHFVGSKIKPWDFFVGEYHSLWWKYARETPFYETIISRNCIRQSSSEISKSLDLSEVLQAIYKIKSLGKLKRKYIFYRFMKEISFGKIKKHFKAKKAKTKMLIKEAKELKRKIRKKL